MIICNRMMVSADHGGGGDSCAYARPSYVERIVSLTRSGACVPPLEAAGDVGLLERPCVAVVGSRNASDGGCQLAWAVAGDLVGAGFVVMSGLAAGIDTAAHRGAIESGGRTIAILGTPLDRAYPAANAALQERIYRGDLLLSPFPSGTRTTRGHFPLRNRIMARLAEATVVVEAGETSGTIHQVREALAVNRRVFVRETLLRPNGARWLRALASHRGVLSWTTPDDVLAVLRRP
jgi:DNA processing protein